MVRGLAHEPESRRLIDATRGDEHVVGPQGELTVAEFARPRDACADQRASDPERARLDVEKPQLGDCRVVALHEENRAGDRSVKLGDPTVLARRVEFSDEISKNPAGQPLVGPVPSVFLVIENRLAMDDPADISRLEGTQPDARALSLAVLESCANVPHRFREPLSPTLVNGKEKRVDLRTGGGVGRGEGFPAR